MVSLAQMRIAWTGIPTGPGVSTFYSSDTASPPLAALRAFFNSLGPSLPSAITIQFPTTGNIIDSDNGHASGVWTASAQTQVAGTGGSTFASPLGAVVLWKSGIWVGGRQVMGKTFLVPLAPVCFDGSGNVAVATQTAINGYCTTLLSAAPTLRIFTRASFGVASIANGKVSQYPAVLTSRRK